jgi:transposase
VDHHNGAFVGIDTSKLRNAIAVAEEGRGGDVRYLSEIDTTEAATRLTPGSSSKISQL